MLVKLQNNVPVEWPVNENRIKHENPNVSFPNDVTKIDIAAYGYAKFAYSDRPEYDAEYQDCVEITPVLNGDTYVQTWQVQEMFTAEEKQILLAQKAEQAELNAAASVRSQRDSLLAETDWLVIKAQETGVAMTAEMTAYRQALRDITAQEGFPHTVTWPVKP